MSSTGIWPSASSTSLKSMIDEREAGRQPGRLSIRRWQTESPATARSTAISTCSSTDSLHHDPMKVRLGVALLALVLLAVVIAFLRPTPPPPPIEPSYAGRTLSEWILRNPNALNGNPRSREAREAIRKIGTNALPCLLAWLAADPDHNPIKRAASSVFDVFPQAITPKRALVWAQSDWVPVHLEMAPVAFAVLGPDAAAAIPDLHRLASDARGRRGAFSATHILGGIGPQALPALQRLAQDPACPTRNEAAKEAATLLAQSHTNA